MVNSTVSTTNYGRVELAVEDQWGSVCDGTWTDAAAKVVCRGQNYTDGIAINNAFYGQGTGPIWLHDVACVGTERFIHHCRHDGFHDDAPAMWFPFWFFETCSLHSNDASVFCVNNCEYCFGILNIFKDLKLSFNTILYKCFK